MTDQATQEKLDAMLHGLYWWGVPTLFRCPHDPDPNNCDIALVGVPHSTGNNKNWALVTSTLTEVSIFVCARG